MVDVFFDFTCGYSNRARHWLDDLGGLPARWRPFSLLEVNREGGDEAVFTSPEHAASVSLLALAVFEAVAADGGDTDGYRRQMFSAWHDEHDTYGRLSGEQILGFGRAAGMGRFDREEAFGRIAAEHRAGAELGVFGTPTLVFAPDQAAFVKLDGVPDADAGRRLWRSVEDLATGQPALREWQRPDRSGPR